MEIYSFDTAGVDAWQRDLYASSPSLQDIEKDMIRQHFDLWLTGRFGLTPQQLDYVHNLHPQLVAAIQQSLVSYIDDQLPIVLDKQERKNREGSEDSVKVTELRKWWEGRDKAPSDTPRLAQSASKHFEPIGELTIRIYYVET